MAPLVLFGQENPAHRVPLFFVAIALLLGSTWPLCPLCSLAALLVGALLVVVAVARSLRWLLPLGVALCCLCLGSLRGHHWARVQESALTSGRAVASAIVPLETPEPFGSGTRVSFRAAVRLEDKRAFVARVTANLGDAAGFRPGETALAGVIIRRPFCAMNPGGFDEERYLLGTRTVGLADVVWMGSSYGDSQIASPLGKVGCLWTRFLCGLRDRLARSVDSLFPEDDAAFLKSLFLRDRSDLQPARKEELDRSGFLRFLTVSGFHIDLLAWLVWRGMWALSRRPSLARGVSLCSAVLYASLGGWTAGATRATVACFMKMLAPPLRRAYNPVAAMASSAVILSYTVPFPLCDMGTAMGLAGSAGSWIGGIYAEEYGKGKGASAIRTATVSLGLLTVMARFLSCLSPLSFLCGGLWGAAIIVIFPVSLAMSIIPPLGAILGWIPHLLLEGVRTASRCVGSLPLASLIVPEPPAAAVLGVWLLLSSPLWGILARRSRVPGEDAERYFAKERICRYIGTGALFLGATVTLLSAVLCFWAFTPEVTFLYVGQGDSAVVRAGRSVMLIDTGTEAAFKTHVAPYLRSKGIGEIQVCVLSHLHDDHIGGLGDLVAEFKVGRIAVPPGCEAYVEQLVAGTVLRGDAPEVVAMSAGRRYVWAGLPIDVVLPQNSPPSSVMDEELGGNEMSLVFVLHLDGSSFGTSVGPWVEFWGDSPSSCADLAFRENPWMLRGSSPRVVKVPHHGSPDAFDSRLYSRAGANDLSVAVVSVGPNGYGHPSDLVIGAAGSLGRVFRTDRVGAVTVKGSRGGVRVHTFVRAQDSVE